MMPFKPMWVRTIVFVATASCCLPLAAQGADLTVTGSLRSVTADVITVRLDDGRVVDARLPARGVLSADAIVAAYRRADQVQIACKSIRATLEAAADRFQVLQLTAIRFVRAPTPDEILEVSASLSWHKGQNLLRPSTVIPPERRRSAPALPDGFERRRDVNRARLETMPTYLADERATRWRRPKGSGTWRQMDIVDSEISFRGKDAVRESVRIDGKPWSGPSSWLPGVNWGIGFGTELETVFKEGCVIEFTTEGSRELRGQQVGAYAFRTPMDGCFGPDTVDYWQYAAEHRGHILVDAGGRVVQMEHQSATPPGNIGSGSAYILTWGDVKIGDDYHLLPLAEHWMWTAPNGDTWRVVAEYTNHRHFETAVRVLVGAPPGRK